MTEASTAARTKAHVTALAGVIGERHVGRPDAYGAAADYIRRELIGAGHTVHEQPFEAHGIPCANLEVIRHGTDPALACLVVGAHYDTVAGTPGADDNASGVAALIEIARALAAVAPRRTVRLAAFANEEAPHFGGPGMGSLVYANALKAAGEKVRLMASLEMLGYYDDTPGSQKYPPLLDALYPDAGNFIGLVGNLHAWTALGDLKRAFKAASSFPVEHLAAPEWVPGVSQSDQYAFWQNGYTAVMVTDTAFYRNPHYHTATDTPDTLDYAALGAVTDGLSGAFARLAGA